MRVVVDTSALLAIRENEPEREVFHARLLESEPVMSLATLTELRMVWQGRYGASTLADVDRLVSLYRISVEPVEVADGPHLAHAILAYGRGRAAEPAVLNFGDLFSYALARRLDLPLLFKGADFPKTDVIPAWKPSPPG